MKRTGLALICLLAIGLAGNGRADIVDNLVSNDWNSSGYTELSTVGNINTDFETVTNEIPAEKEETFIRLTIEDL